MRMELRARTPEEAERCEQWYDSGPGFFALGLQKNAIKKMMSAWPRRQQTLLEIDCGSGAFLDTFYTAGIDVTAIESCPELLARARAKTGSQIDLHLGRPEHLPFDDREFDFAAIISGLDFSPQPGRAIIEAARVAKKGLLIGFLNRYSLSRLFRHVETAKQLYPFYRARWFSPRSLYNLIVEATGYKSITMAGLLPGPLFTWKQTTPWRQLNKVPMPWFACSFCLAKIDFIDEPPMNPLMAFTSQKHFTRKQEQATLMNRPELDSNDN